MLVTRRFDNKDYMKVSICQVAEKNPKQRVDVRTSSVYSQIARTGRNPSKTKERKILVSALKRARKSRIINGEVVITEPKYIPMKAEDVVSCFGEKKEIVSYAKGDYDIASDKIKTFMRERNGARKKEKLDAFVHNDRDMMKL